jgi:hypothetical protein
MTVVCGGEVIELRGDCPVEDAETLLAALSELPARAVDVTNAGQLHSAVFQVLLATQAPLRGPAGDAFTQAWLMPGLVAQQGGQEEIVLF